MRRAFEQRYRVPILVNYGSTEAGHIAGWTGRDMKAGRWKPGSAGRVYPGVELEIRDDDGTALPTGAEGEVVVRSALTRGYVDDAEASAELVRDGWVHTGDMGYVDEDGVLFLVGRKRDMIKCGGFQVWPEEIEDELRAHPLVRDVRVLGRPDDRLGEIPRGARGPRGRRRGHRRRARRRLVALRPGAAGPLQGPAADRVRGRAPGTQRHRQDQPRARCDDGRVAQ